MSKDKEKHKEEISQKVLDAISSWRLIYDKERDIYIKVACVSVVKGDDIDVRHNESS